MPIRVRRRDLAQVAGMPAALEQLALDTKPGVRRKYRKTEDDLHVRIWRELQPLLGDEIVVWSTENRALGVREGLRRKRRGCIAGVPDMVFHWNPGQIAYVELKPPGSYPTAEQRNLHLRLRGINTAVRVCRSTFDVMDFLSERGAPLRIKAGLFRG